MDEIRISGVIFSHGGGTYGLWNGIRLSEQDENAIQAILSKYDTQGVSVRGTMDEIIKEMGE